MQLRKLLCLAVTLLLVSTIRLWGQNIAPAPGKLTLEKAVQLAWNNNIPLQQKKLITKSTNIDYQQAKVNRLPDLNGNFNNRWNNGRTVNPYTNGYSDKRFVSSNIGMNSNIILFSGLRLQSTIHQTDYAYQASRMEEQQTKDELTLNVLSAYLNILNFENDLENVHSQAEVTREQVERLTILYNSGAIASYQLTDIKGQLAADEAAIVNIASSLQTAKLSLCQLLNIPYNKDLELEKITDIPAAEKASPTNEIYNSALQNLAQIRAVNLRVKSAVEAVNIAKSAYYPQLSLVGNLNSNYSSISFSSNPTFTNEVSTGNYVYFNGAQTPVYEMQQVYDYQKIPYINQFKNNLGYYIGLNLSIPIFNKFLVKNNVQKAVINEQYTSLEADNTKLMLKQNVEQAHLNMTSAFDRYQTYKEQVNQLQESFRSAEIRFNAGLIVSTEYLIAKNNLDQAGLNLSKAWYDYLFGIRVVNFYQGKLTF